MTLQSNAALATRTIVGIIILGAAIYAGHTALSVRPIDGSIVKVAAGLLVLGGLVLDFDGVFPALKNLATVVVDGVREARKQ